VSPKTFVSRTDYHCHPVFPPNFSPFFILCVVCLLIKSSGIHALKGTCVNDRIVSVDCKYIGLDLGWNKRKSGLGSVRLTYLRTNFGLWLGQTLLDLGPVKFLKFRSVRTTSADGVFNVVVGRLP
jgi:hypothetical protein